MPFVKVSRDKRGYEQISLMHIFGGRKGKPSKPRILYVFRTPPGVKVGREPFDPEVRQALELQNPGVVFDWKRLSNIPVPAPDVEFWRERRRAEKAAKAARRAEETGEPSESIADEPADDEPSQELADVEGELSEPESFDALADQAVDDEPADAPAEMADAEAKADSSQPAPGDVRPEGQRRRRRRGGRRRRRGHRPDVANTPNQTPADAPRTAEQTEPGAEPSKLPGDSSKEA